MKPVIFLGPTLDAAAARSAIDADWRPPAAQGDIYRAVRAGAHAIGLIDGVFLDLPSVWHREVLHALSVGVHVFGAASMGAMRAAELEPFGMRGSGAIYAAYRYGRWPGCAEPFEDDDEVAVIHAPAEAASTALSDAMVDLRATLLAALAADVVTHARCHALIADMKRLHYSQRSFLRLAQTAPELREWLDANRVAQKRLDALEMLRAIAAFVATDPAPHRAMFRFERALVWERFVASQDATTDAEARSVLDELRFDPTAWRAGVRAVSGTEDAPPTGEAERRSALDRLRREHGLWQRATLDDWVRANGMDAAALVRLLDREAALDRVVRAAGGSLDGRIADHLRATGIYATLREHASRISDQDQVSGGPAADAMHAWYFDRIGTAVPHDLDRWARENGWSDRFHFDTACWRRYRRAMQTDATPSGSPTEPA